MSNRNKGRYNNIRKFPVKAGNTDLLKASINGIADDMVSSFSEMISAKTDALNWAIDQLPQMLTAAGLPQMPFEIADGLYPFLLSGFADTDDEEDENDFEGIYPCFTTDGDLPAGVLQYDLVLFVNEDEEDTEEGSHRIDAFLTREEEDGTMYMFDGEQWIDMEELMEDDEDDIP